MTTVEDVEVLGTEVRLRRTGSGPPLLFVHGEDGLLFAEPFVDMLAERFSVLVPSHPAWQGACPRHIRTLDDIAYVYLELIEQLNLSCAVVGTSIGAWIAAEMATKNDTRMSMLVLAAPIGIKTVGREERAFVDLYAVNPQQARAALYAETAKAPDPKTFSDERFLALAMAQEAVTRFAWEPYMHNPQLGFRLARIGVPTLVVTGGSDTFVLEPNYGRTYCRLIGGNARLTVIEGAGHRVEEEAPARLRDAIASFSAEQLVTAGTRGRIAPGGR